MFRPSRRVRRSSPAWPRLAPSRVAALAAALAVAGPVAVAAPLAAQVAPAAPRPAAAPAAGARPAAGPMMRAVDTAAYAGLRWRELGPARGGRSVAVAGSVARPREYWMGTTGGGVFKSTNGGLDWAPMTDRYFGGTIGAIAVDERNPDVVYVGTGETPIRGNVSHGEGVWKTTNGGRTWTHLGLTETRQIARVRIDPRNSDRIYVAALGNVFTSGPERGIYRSDDAGRTWRKILFRDDSTGAIDLVVDPSNPDVMYASFWQAGRTAWMLSSGGKGSGIFKTTNGGDSWTEISRAQGLPQGLLGKIGLAVSPAKPQRVWALIEADSGGVYRSDDGGSTWSYVNRDRSLRQRAWYYTRIFADPKDSNTVYGLNVSFYRSTDGGRTFRGISTPHSDNHDLWIAANDPQRMIESNDGGANVSTDGGRTWTEQDYPTAQFYHVTTSNEFPYHVCGAQQDNSTLCGPSRSPGGVNIEDWYDAGGGESGYIAVNPRNPDIIYAGSYGGLLTRLDRETGIERNVSPWPLNPMGQSSEDIRYRFQWTYPIVFSRHDANVLYAGGSQLFRTTTEGQSWEIVSPPLARNDPKTMGPSGGPITRDQTGVETYGVIFAFDESPITRGLLWAGSDDGLIHVSRDNARTWQNVTPPAALLPEFARISIIEPSPYDAGTAYVAANRYQMGDMRPYLLKTTDYGRSWTRIDNGITGDGHFTRVVRADPVRRGLLYAGTERGMWVSFDDGANWQRLQLNLPPVPVHDLAVKEGDLIAATHGRSFWVIDDLSALRQLSPAVAAADAHLYKPRDAHRVQFGGGFGGGGGGGGGSTVGQNPPAGPVVYYWLKQPNQTVTLDFLDASGKVIRSFTSALDSAAAADSVRREAQRVAARDSLVTLGGLSPDSAARVIAARGAAGPGMGAGGGGGFGGGGGSPRAANRQGLNQFVWNMRYPDASTFRGIIMWAGNTTGPMAPPGTYSVRLRVNGGEPQTQSFRLLKDPRTSATQADLMAQFNFLVEIRDAVSAANDAVRTIRNVKYQLNERGRALRGADSAGFARTAADFTAKLSAVEGELYQVRNQSGQDPLNYPIKLNNKIAALSGHVASAEGAPTAQSRQVFAELKRDLDRHLATLKQVMDGTLPQVNAALTRAGQAAIVPSTAELGAPPAQVAGERGGEEEGEM